MTIKQVQFKAEGLRSGGATSVCVNLVSDSAGRLVNAPSISTEGIGEKGVERLPITPPPVRWRVTPSGEMTHPVESFAVMAGDMESIAPLSRGDLEKYSATLSAAYKQLSRKSREAGVFMQPVVVRYRLTDAEGRTLFRSQPVVLTLTTGWQCAEPFETAVSQTSKGFTIHEFMLRAETFMLEAEVPDYSAYSDVATVELEVSEELHPVDTDLTAAVAFRLTNSNNPKAAVALPGATSWLTPLGGERAARLAAAGGDVAMHTARRLEASAAGRVDIRPIEMAVKKQEAMGGDRRLAVCRPPHGLKATTMEQSGDTVVYGGITPLLWPGPHPAELLTIVGEERAMAEVRVWFGERTTVRREWVEVPADGVIYMTPFVSYPHPGATRMELIVTRGDGKRAGASRTLTPTDSGDGAASASDSLLPIELTPLETVSTPPDYTEPAQPGLILAARADEPNWPVAATMISGCVNGLIAADRSLSSWDAASARLYMIASDGVHGVSANAAARECSATLLHRLNVAEITWCGGSLYAATDHGVMRLAGTQLNDFVVTRRPVISLTADNRYRLMIIELASGEKRLLSPEGVMATIAEDGDRTEWEASAAIAPGLRAVEMLVDIRSDCWQGVIELLSEGGEGGGERGRDRELLLRVTVDGAVTRPVLVRRISAPHRARLTLRLAGRGKLSVGASTITLA